MSLSRLGIKRLITLPVWKLTSISISSPSLDDEKDFEDPVSIIIPIELISRTSSFSSSSSTSGAGSSSSSNRGSPSSSSSKGSSSSSVNAFSFWATIVAGKSISTPSFFKSPSVKNFIFFIWSWENVSPASHFLYWTITSSVETAVRRHLTIFFAATTLMVCFFNKSLNSSRALSYCPNLARAMAPSSLIVSSSLSCEKENSWAISFCTSSDCSGVTSALFRESIALSTASIFFAMPSTILFFFFNCSLDWTIFSACW